MRAVCHDDQLFKDLPRRHRSGGSGSNRRLHMAKRFSNTDTRVTLGRILRVAAEMCRGSIFDWWRWWVNCGWWGYNLAAVQVILVGQVFYQESFFVCGTPVVMGDSCVGVFLGMSLFYLKTFLQRTFKWANF